MKTIILYFILLFVLLNLNCIANTNILNDSAATVSSDTMFCSGSNMEGYDFRSQSSNYKVKPGDSIVCTTILYSKQDFRVMVCGNSGYNSVNFKIIEQTREIIQKVNKINESEEIIYKLDEYGEPVLGSDDKPVVLSKDVLRDTIWDKTVIIHEKIIFEGDANKQNYFDFNNNEKTRRIVIKTYTTGQANNENSYISVMIGRKYAKPFQY